ncbi:hypothetical protein SAMN06296273_2714 [Nitrosomonas ureae]|uniref:Uncharacterized protein n=1 Tax=Nitrosomonas ureae TaxID=44577 RepID=A0A285C106_9PROT|nr:hypothetical protein [Nitrosomonas ureae]SNX61261.1 hypothetical protein SAMN06296273_2714 [Nitrosomonas ureae]
MPYAKDNEPIYTARWIDDLWTVAIRRAEASPLQADTEMIIEEEIYILLGDTPAISKETVSTWEVFEQIKDIPDIRPFSFFVTLPGIEQWMVDERIRQSGKSLHVNPELLEVGYYAPFSTNINGIMANLTRKDNHEQTPQALTATLAEKALHYFAHAENKAYPPNGIGQLHKQPVIVEKLAYCGKETQTLYSSIEDGESSGITLIGERGPQIFNIEPPEGLTTWLDRPLKTLLQLGLTRQEICKEFDISDKTLSNYIAGQPVGFAKAEHYIKLFQRILRDRNVSTPDDFIRLTQQVSSAADDLKMLIEQGRTVPKLAHELGKSARQIYRWLRGSNCNVKIRWKIKALLVE